MKTMVKKIIFLVTILCIIGYAGHLFLPKLQNNFHAMRIAVFQPISHPAVDEIAQTFMNEMQKSDQNYLITQYNGNGNKVLLHAQAKEILEQSYDLVLTIGLGCSLAMKELSQKQHNKTPIIFTAIDEPMKFNIQGDNITGVQDQTHYRNQLDLTIKLIPSIKKVLLVYDPSQGSGLEKDVIEIQSILHDHHVVLQLIEVNGVTEIQQKLTGYMDDADIIMILKDNTIVSGIDSIVKLCQKYKVPLLASDLNSGEKGAALAYGIYESESGMQGAVLAKKVLEQGLQPKDIPVASVDKMIMKINREQAIQQGLAIDFDAVTAKNIQ